MKAQYLATPLTRFCLFYASMAALPAFLLAQPYIPPAVGGLNIASGAVQPPIYQQSAPHVSASGVSQRPVSPTQTTDYIPSSHPKPTGYAANTSYRPPTLTKPSVPKKSPVNATQLNTAASKKSSTSIRPSSTHPSSKTSGNTIESKVTRQKNSDFRQDIHPGNLEKNVELLPDRHEGGNVTDLAPIGSHYIARPGDTLLGIAARHGTSANALRNLNHLNSDVVDIGQSLLIPHHGDGSSGDEKSTGVHIVKSGDTLTKLARDFGISADALARANATVHPDRLLIGERLLIPSRSSTSHGSSPRSEVFSASSSKSTDHIVRKGEHLGFIAKRYGVTTSALARANRLKNANIIEVGDRLVIPGHSSSRSTSQVAITDQDAAPLEDFRIPEPPPPPVKPEPIAPLPPISSNIPTLTSVGSSKTRGVVAYRMERGDTLDSVANMFSTTTENIRALNQFPSDKVLEEGHELFVPSIGAVSVN